MFKPSTTLQYIQLTYPNDMLPARILLCIKYINVCVHTSPLRYISISASMAYSIIVLVSNDGFSLTYVLVTGAVIFTVYEVGFLMLPAQIIVRAKTQGMSLD